MTVASPGFNAAGPHEELWKAYRSPQTGFGPRRPHFCLSRVENGRRRLPMGSGLRSEGVKGCVGGLEASSRRSKTTALNRGKTSVRCSGWLFGLRRKPGRLYRWVQRMKRIRKRCSDLLGADGWRWRVLRTPNAYAFHDPGAADRNPSGQDPRVFQRLDGLGDRRPGAPAASAIFSYGGAEPALGLWKAQRRASGIRLAYISPYETY